MRKYFPLLLVLALLATMLFATAVTAQSQREMTDAVQNARRAFAESWEGSERAKQAAEDARLQALIEQSKKALAVIALCRDINYTPPQRDREAYEVVCSVYYEGVRRGRFNLEK